MVDRENHLLPITGCLLMATFVPWAVPLIATILTCICAHTENKHIQNNVCFLKKWDERALICHPGALVLRQEVETRELLRSLGAS